MTLKCVVSGPRHVFCTYHRPTKFFEFGYLCLQLFNLVIMMKSDYIRIFSLKLIEIAKLLKSVLSFKTEVIIYLKFIKNIEKL